MKSFWKYFLIVLLLLVGLVAMGFLYLFFIPNASLFGLQYISLNEKSYSKAYTVDSIDKVILNTRAYDTNVIVTEDEEISVKVHARNIGFVRTKNSKVHIDTKIENRALTFTITEPHGATILNDSQVVLKLPATKAFDLTISNDKSYTTIGDDVLIDDLVYNTNIGDIEVNKAKISGTIDSTLNNAYFTINKAAILNTNNVILDVKSGKFDATSHTLGDITIENNNNAVILLNDANKIDMNVSNAGGKIEADTIGSVEISASDTNVYINKITNVGIILLSKSGSVNIGQADGSTRISTKTGNIKIKAATSPLNLINKNGNIDVLDTTSSVDATNTYGYIYVKFNDDALSYEYDTLSRHLKATNENGKITCIGADNVDIKATKDASVELRMHDIVGESNIVGAKGSVYVNISAEAQFLLSTESKGSVSVNLSQIDNVGTGGYNTGDRTETYINGYEGDSDILNISTTSGALTVRDYITSQLG